MSEKARVLIIDDDDDYRAAISHVLEANGYEPMTASTKEEGLAMLQFQDTQIDMEK